MQQQMLDRDNLKTKQNNCSSRKPDKLGTLSQKAEEMDWELKMTKEVTRFQNQKNGCTTQGLERFLRERLELLEVLVKAITEKNFQK